MVEHRFKLNLEVEASSFGEVADRLRDIATDIDIGQAAPQSLFAGGGSRGHYTLTDTEQSGSSARGSSGDAGAPSASHATVGQASAGSGGVTPGDES